MLEHKQTISHRLYQIRLIIVLTLTFVGLSVYVGFLTFGNKSFLTLAKNQKLEKTLKDKVNRLHIENETLQKKYFELKSLEP